MSEFQEESSGKSKSGFFVIVIVVLLGIMGYMAYTISKSKKEIAKWQTENARVVKENKEISSILEEFGMEITADVKSDLKTMLASYDEMLSKGGEDSATILQQKAQIEDLLNEVDQNKWKGSELVRLRKENESLRQNYKAYVIKYDSLYTLKTKLETDLRVVETDLTVTKDELSATQSNLNQANDKIKVGQKLQAFGFSSGGMKQKLNSTLEETNRANNCVQLFSKFTISENKLTTPGTKTVYMQIIDPKGKTLQSSGSNNIETDNGRVPFTDDKDIDYQNQRTDLAIYFRLGSKELDKGNYKVNIYCQGQLIGSDSFTLK